MCVGVGGVVRGSESASLGVGGVANVDVKDDKSCVGHLASRSSGTFGREHGHKHEHGQMGMGNGQIQSIRVTSSSSVAIAPSAIRRPRIARIDDPLSPHVSDLTTRNVPVLIPSVPVLMTTIHNDDDENHVPMTMTTTMTSSAVIQPHPASCGGSQSPRHRQPLAEARGQVPVCPTSNEALVGSGCPLELRKTEF